MNRPENTQWKYERVHRSVKLENPEIAYETSIERAVEKKKINLKEIVEIEMGVARFERETQASLFIWTLLK